MGSYIEKTTVVGEGVFREDDIRAADLANAKKFRLILKPNFIYSIDMGTKHLTGGKWHQDDNKVTLMPSNDSKVDLRLLQPNVFKIESDGSLFLVTKSLRSLWFQATGEGEDDHFQVTYERDSR